MTQRMFHVVGPPGTGKTTYLMMQAVKSVEKNGTKSTLLCSLTKSAAHEMSGRGTPVADDMIGTLHAHCYRMMGNPDIAESKIKEWNKEFHEHRLAGGNETIDDLTDRGGDGQADQDMAAMNTLRASMTDYNLWPDRVRNFHAKWCKWKSYNGLYDFTDLIETCIDAGGKAPSNPSVMIGDEAQDWSRLEFKLFCDTWGRYAETVILAGDFDQCLYSWRGADPDYFINHPVPLENRRVRGQSYRVPKAVHAKALQWIRTVSKREDVTYLPTESQGLVTRLNATFKYCDRLIDDIHYQIDRGKTSMILTSCSYMLKQIIHNLRKEGIPFANNYRRQNALWNPLGRKKNCRMPVDRISAFLAPRIEIQDSWRRSTLAKWTKPEFKSWASALETSMFRRGVKANLDNDVFKVPESMGEWMQVFKDEDDAHNALFLDTQWYMDNLMVKYKESVGFAVRAAHTYGETAVTTHPPVTVGTIHSVKGGEADCVYLFPDISLKSMMGWNHGGEAKDSIIRAFYVGMTRAKEELILCNPNNGLSVTLA